VFTLEAPRILNTSVSLLQYYAAQNPARPVTPPGASTVSATGPVTPDPVKGPPNFDPDTTYTSFVKEEIVTAMLACTVSIKADESLTIAASSMDFVKMNALYPAASSRMSFQIKGADLIAYQQGRITRPEAVSKITQTKF
jgi:hypothetical protein